MAAALTITSLEKLYDDGTVALRGLDLEIRNGSFLGLLGPNGSGKTTLIGMVTRLSPALPRDASRSSDTTSSQMPTPPGRPADVRSTRSGGSWGSMMSAVLIALGIGLVLATLREVFHSLFHPSGQGGLTMLVFRVIWRVSGSMGPGARSVAGPVSLVCVIALWVGGTVVGWALIYLPALPGDFIFASPLLPSEQSGFLVALYQSWVTQATLGYGDIAPEAAALRILAPLQATLGFVLFTLVATWVLSIYPALRRQRAAAALAHALRESHLESGTSTSSIHPAAAGRQMERLSQAVDDLRVDLIQYPSTFYFAAPAGTLSLAGAIPFIADAARAEGYAPEARPGAAELASSLDLLASTIGDQHLAMPDAARGEVLEAYRRHHGLVGGEQGQAL